MSDELHQLRVKTKELESQLAESRRLLAQLEDTVSTEQAENRRIVHMVNTKNAEIEELKKLAWDQKNENVQLQESMQRLLSASAARTSVRDTKSTEVVDRWVQTLVDITPPEEVEQMREELELLRQQVEEQDLGYTRHRLGSEGMYDDEMEPSPEVPVSARGDHLGASFSRPPALQLNFALPRDLAGQDDVMPTGRGSVSNETPRAAACLRIPPNQALLSARVSTIVGDQGGYSTARRVKAYDGTDPSATPRVSVAAMMRRTYVDPAGAPGTARTSAAGAKSPSNASFASRSPASPQALSPPAQGAPVVPPLATIAAGDKTPPPKSARAIDEVAAEVGNQAHLRQTQMYPLTARGERKERFEGEELQLGATVDYTNHMFSIEHADGACPICELMETIQTKLTGQRVSRESYYAVGWLPEMCHRWSQEHNLVWTIEERATVATALTNRPKLAAFTTFTHAGPVNIWRKRSFWRNPWRPAHAVLQGVFLYIFDDNNPQSQVVAAMPVRASFIELVTLSGRNSCIQISSLGCKSCVGANDGDCVETMTISVDTVDELQRWETALVAMQRTCAHKCSSKFLNEVASLRDISEMLVMHAKQAQMARDKRSEEANRIAAAAK